MLTVSQVSTWAMLTSARGLQFCCWLSALIQCIRWQQTRFQMPRWSYGLWMEDVAPTKAGLHEHVALAAESTGVMYLPFLSFAINKRETVVMLIRFNKCDHPTTVWVAGLARFTEPQIKACLILYRQSGGIAKQLKSELRFRLIRPTPVIWFHLQVDSFLILKDSILWGDSAVKDVELSVAAFAPHVASLFSGLFKKPHISRHATDVAVGWWRVHGFFSSGLREGCADFLA